MKKNSFETQILHTPFEKEDAYHSLSMPVYHTAAYEFETAEEMEAAFCGRTAGHAYSRITNPTVQYFEQRVQAVTGALSVTALNSGMAAISNALITLASAGANIVTSAHLFGNTYSFLKSTLGAFGVEVRFCDLTCLEEVERQIDENTCALFLEVITNPQLEVADLKALAGIVHSAGVPLLADTTAVPFHVFRAADFGVDIEIVSSTKYISGGATCIGGLIIDYGTFDWGHSGKLAALSTDTGKEAFTPKLRRETLGLETMEVRFARQAETCLKLARCLQELPEVESVNYTGLETNPFYELSTRQFGSLPGAMLTFDLPSREICFRFINRLRIIRRATNLFDNKTLAIHPASTIYGSFTEEQRRDMDISQKTIRLSVGLERTDDLLEDIIQALKS